jgi:CubicO group peptidase (beta-lactamase class C family)
MSRPAAAGEIADRLARRHVGVALGVLDVASGEQKLLARGSTGRAVGSAVTANTFFEIGSITKTFTALVLATMVESGRVRLDTPVRELLPGVAVPARDGAQITLEQLARHTSGLPRSPQPFARDLWIARVQQSNPYTMDEETVLAALGEIRLKHKPGDGHGAYSNLGAGLLGIALRRAAEAGSYQDLVRDAVLRPLGLSDTAVRLAPEQEARLAQGHGMRRRPVDAWYLDGLAGAGALRSTAPDLLRYLRAQAEPDSTPLAGAIRLTHQLAEPDRRHTFGLGWMRTRLPTGDLWWHNGGTGGFRSFAGFGTDQRRVATVLVNDGRGPEAAGFELIAGRRRQR